MLKARSKIENQAATRREAFPNFYGKTAAITLADKKNYRYFCYSFANQTVSSYSVYYTCILPPYLVM